MKPRFCLLLFITLVVVFGFTNTSVAQAGYGRGSTITCSSNNGQRNYCNVDTRGGVRLSRQISGSACIQGQSWDSDRHGIWVDRGCRAEFIVGGGRVRNSIVTCSSDNGRRNFCGADVRGGVRLTRQISGSPCIQGKTWGYGKSGIWVDRGCRAEFSVR